jgi:hypothetical protein
MGDRGLSYSIVRRDFLKLAGASASLMLSPPAFAATAEQSAVIQINMANLSISEKIMHSTVRIVSPIDATHASVGTGFLFSFPAGPNLTRIVVVTNKHVIAGPGAGFFWLTQMKPDGTADFSKHLTITANWKTDAILHPDPAIDLAVIPIGGALNNFITAGNPAFFSTLDKSLIPSEDAIKDLVPLEPLVTVGYPEGIIDSVNNLPVFHRGVAATPLYVDFDGKPDFLIDIATWPGSSGSPVFLYDSGTIFDYRKNTVSIGQRLQLLGIIYKDFEENSAGQIEIQNPPSSNDASRRNPMNIGICVKSRFILDFEPIVAKLK